MSETEYTQPQIELMASRATKFLSAASQVPSIRAALGRGGYDEAEHRAGWDLLLDVLGYRSTLGSAADNEHARQAQAAAELDAWDGPNFERARAALERNYPEQSAYVFDGLTAKSGAEAITAVRTFVERCAALREGTDGARKSARKQDRAAIELLAARRIFDREEETRLRALIDQATSLADLPAQNQPDPSARQRAAQKLDSWLRDWRASARVLVTRRDYQIRLGLAERRTAKEDSAAPAADGADPLAD